MFVSSLAHERRFRQLDHRAARVGAVSRDRVHERALQGVVPELQRRHVDRDPRLVDALAFPRLRSCSHACADDPVADRHDEPGFLGDRDELVRRDEVPSGRRQRSSASKPAIEPSSRARPAGSAARARRGAIASPSASSISRRRRWRSRSSSSYSSTRLPPRRFAAYIASSALRISASTSVEWSSLIATPTLMVMCDARVPFSCSGAPTAATIRSATANGFLGGRCLRTARRTRRRRSDRACPRGAGPS